MPEQLPQSWVRLSQAARGFAYDWWRTFRDDVVDLSIPQVCTAIGTPPRARKKATGWVTEMVDSGALVRTESGLAMVDPMDSKRSRKVPKETPKSTQREPTTTPKSTRNDPKEYPKSTHKETQATEIMEPKNAPYTDRERERYTLSSAALQEWSESHRAWWSAKGKTAPTVKGLALTEAASRALDASRQFSVPLAEVTRWQCDSASKLSSKPWPFALRDCEISKPAASQWQDPFAAVREAMAKGAANG